MKEHRYQTRPLQPLPFPKKNKATGQHRLRPYFYVDLDDQLVWTAMVNVLSGHGEKKMPFWSYGNRLFRPVWFEVDPVTHKRKLIKGACRNTSANLYRPWGQSWPLYKQHISMTIKVMAKTSQFEMTDLEDQIEQDIYQRAEDDRFQENRFLDKNHWTLSIQQRLQNLLFPNGIRFNKELACYRTLETNSFVSLFLSLSAGFENKKTRQFSENTDLSRLVVPTRI